MLRKIRFVDYGTDCAYAPLVTDGIIEESDIVSVRPCVVHRRSGLFVEVRLQDGTTWTVEGVVDDFVDPMEGRRE